MAITSALKDCLQQQLTEAIGKPVSINTLNPVSGGSINDAYCLFTSDGKYMLKVNDKAAYPNMFQLEADGLNTIKASKTIATPSVVCYDDGGNQSFLVLEWIETGKADASSSVTLGHQLASMHRHTTDQFGLIYNNYMGSLPQSNRQHSNWCDFFITERLMPMVKIGQAKRLLSISDSDNFEKLYRRLPTLFAEEPSALLHGDLWSGNYLIDQLGTPYLIDPAISYGNREFDIAMTTLFGGFSTDFYKAYNEAFPLNAGWQQRLDLWNLYPLLLHLNLFGTSYLSRIRTALKLYM